MTRKHYTRLAKWIAENSAPHSIERESMIQTAFFIIRMDDERKGNQKLFNPERFVQFIYARDTED